MLRLRPHREFHSCGFITLKMRTLMASKPYAKQCVVLAKPSRLST